MTADETGDHIARNRSAWNTSAAEYRDPGRRNWASEPSWGIWGIPEREANLLPDVEGLHTIELGCGTAYVSAWLARRGARPVGIDLSENQLATARALQDEHDLHFPLIHGSAEAVPVADATFDLAISEYGAAIWCDPYRWIPEAARVLRRGGQLIFLGNGPLLVLTMTDSDAEGPAGTALRRDYFGMHRYEWPDDDGVEFHLNHGDWIRLLRGSGFEVEDLIELRPSGAATTRYPFVTLDWALRWPSEEVWVARRR
ncbi:MAG TPA: class I SAM-dependent methyltransferase [Candidatus Dormibacteraeota bacterium]|jgi:SAM-dependent methyltransferase|nr:class I SAM-dependent methyltransferase [Candidatus Dormibacteraeota bacterium]